jgi:tetratricopeptide (TPR) repeat protein
MSPRHDQPTHQGRLLPSLILAVLVFAVAAGGCDQRSERLSPNVSGTRLYETVDGSGYVKLAGPSEAEIRFRAGEPAVVGAWSEDASRVRIEIDTVAGQEALYFRRTEGGLVSESISGFEVFEGTALAMQRAFENGREASRAGRCREAIPLFDEAGRLGHPLAHEALAWELATAAAVECHDGPRAIGEAKAALATGETAERLDTLAAAYARNGDFDSALQAQTKALALLKAGGSDSIDRSERQRDYEDRWSFYELRQAYQRDP